MSYITYKIGQYEETIQFDQMLEKDYTEILSKDFFLQITGGYILKPTVSVSLFPPLNINEWIGYRTTGCKGFNIFLKQQNNKLYFHIQVFKFLHYVPSLIFNCLLVSILLRYDILMIHGMLLSNGDIIFGESESGKTTLAKRINCNNKNLICLCDDNVLLDLKNNTAYPLPYFWDKAKDYIFRRDEVQFKEFKTINRFLCLNKQQIGLENIYNMDENDFKQRLFNCLITFLYYPFVQRNEDKNNQEKWWINFKKELKDEVQKRISEIIDKYIDKIKPLMLVINSRDISKKFEVIEDV